MPCPCRPGGLTVAALTLALGLSGCGGGGESVGEALGYEQKGPDEMAVIKRPPLTVPPDFNLRPPRPDEPRSEAAAASKAARDTLVGPSSELAPETLGTPAVAPVNATSSSDLAGAGDRARATLTGQEEDRQRYHKSPPLLEKEEQVAAVTAETPASAGQNALLSRTNRVERDLGALNETRGENRVDGALLRRLLAWQPAAAVPETADTDGVDTAGSGNIVNIVRREQTPVRTGTSSE